VDSFYSQGQLNLVNAICDLATIVPLHSFAHIRLTVVFPQSGTFVPASLLFLMYIVRRRQLVRGQSTCANYPGLGQYRCYLLPVRGSTLPPITIHLVMVLCG
jgi:hypothetical protein